MNFLVDQAVANGESLKGPHYKHCYIYEGQHCSCGGNYQGDAPGPTLCECGTSTNLLHDCDAADRSVKQ
ncbi:MULTISPECIES: hypothetical protein [Streptomyces]|uniref:hypothetical protein n=1 Tax=Streptomyces TaxID=1883 RepID=UPI002F912867